MSISPECGNSGTRSVSPESSSLKGIKSGTGSGISAANDARCGTPGTGVGIPGNQPVSGYPELHTVLQPFTGPEVPNNLQQFNTALKESLQGREVPLTYMAFFSCVLNMVSGLAGLGSPRGTGVMYSKGHPLSTSTNIPSPVQHDSDAYCALSAVSNDDDVIYEEENTVLCSALEDQTVSSDRTPPSRESYAPDSFIAVWVYPRSTDYRQSSVLKQQALPPSDATHFHDGLTALNLLTTDRAIDLSFPHERNIFHLSSLFDVARCQAIVRSKKSIPRGQYRVRSSVINKVSAWTLHTGQPISVEVYAKRGLQFFGCGWCSKVDALNQSWNDEILWLHPSPSQ